MEPTDERRQEAPPNARELMRRIEFLDGQVLGLQVLMRSVIENHPRPVGLQRTATRVLDR